LNPSVAHKAADKPSIEEIYSPPRHADALDPNRALVIGGRGVGKSFWAAVLANKDSRAAAAESYPKLSLDRLEVALGFHEGALGTEAVAPSPAALKTALDIVDDPASIWRSVLLKVIAPELGPKKLRERVKWLEEDPETFEDALLQADNKLDRDGRTLLIVFDALDVLATDWETIRKLTLGLSRLALEMGSRQAIRLKLFMRRDQYEDMRQTTFADFSKLRTAAVELEWDAVDLYGVLFTRLWRDSKANPVLSKLGRNVGIAITGSDLPRFLKTDETKQAALFATFAGEFMGASGKRGRTYTWVPKHLADAHGETSLRSFLIALREAAKRATDRQELAIDHQGINAGVLSASDTRREELKEDHPWVEDALAALDGLTVPCAVSEMIDRWHDAHSLDKIRNRTHRERPAVPIQLELADAAIPEMALIDALSDLGVIERRDQDRINVPDIFRVAAKMKRRGGVAPRRKG
jgi:hypothetical protein